MNAGLAGRRILVTGASGGLGRDFALMLARQGAVAAAGARRAAPLAALADEAAAQGLRIAPVALDVADPESAAAGVAAAARALGGLDGLMNHAGVAWGGPALGAPAADWRRVMVVNLDGAFFMAQAAAQAMPKRIPLRRFGRSEDLLGPLMLLLSDAGARMTGTVIPVDGGHLVAPIA